MLLLGTKKALNNNERFELIKEFFDP